MKTIYLIFVCFLISINPVSALSDGDLSNDSDYSNVVNSEIVYSENGIQIIKIETVDGAVYYNIIAAIATALLPDAVKAICNATVRDKKACDIAYEATSALVSIRGGKIFRGITKGIHWVANRGYKKSTLKINADAYNLASNIKDALETYKDLGCVRWGSISGVGKTSKITNLPYKRDNRMPLALKDVPVCRHHGRHVLKLTNMTSKSIRFQIRNGKKGWETKTLNSGSSKTFSSSSSKYWEVKINSKYGKSFYQKFKCDPDDASCFRWRKEFKDYVALVCYWNQ